jgi:two-component system phosphate regulon response regulator PhoB
MTRETILVIEDDADIAELINYNLASAGYGVNALPDGRLAIVTAQSVRPALILIDWMLPYMTGIEVCAALRENPQTRDIPIILLTAKGEEADKIAGLNAGADDYITKPFSPAELLARMRAVMRRSIPAQAENQMTVLELGPLRIDFQQRRVTNAGVVVRLGPTEFRLLACLMQHPEEVLSRDRLLELVWDKDINVEPRTVDVHIRRLRKALGDEGDNGLIRTHRLAGYALVV